MAQDVYSTIIELARQYNGEGLFSQAEDFYKQAIAAMRKLFTGNNDLQRLVLIESLSELAAVCNFQGHGQRSERLWQEILELGKNSLKPGDKLYVEAILGLASIQEKKGEIAEAEALYKSLMQKQETAIGSEALEICPAIKKAAAFYCRQQDYAQAEALYLKALALEEFHLGTCSEQINSTVDALANIFRKQKKWRLAEYMLERQKDILNILHGEGSLCAISCELRLGELFRQSGQIEKAMRSYNNVLSTYIKMFGDRAKPVLSLQRKLNQLSPTTISFAPNNAAVIQTKTSQVFVPSIPPVFMAV